MRWHPVPEVFADTRGPRHSGSPIEHGDGRRRDLVPIIDGRLVDKSPIGKEPRVSGPSQVEPFRVRPRPAQQDQPGFRRDPGLGPAPGVHRTQHGRPAWGSCRLNGHREQHTRDQQHSPPRCLRRRSCPRLAHARPRILLPCRACRNGSGDILVTRFPIVEGPPPGCYGSRPDAHAPRPPILRGRVLP